MKLIIILLSILLFISVYLPAQPQYTTVIYVIDGDTFIIDGGARIRLAGLDTPELGTPEGEMARAKLSSLLQEGELVIVDAHHRDRYGRLVAEVTNGSISVNNAMLQSGLAK